MNDKFFENLEQRQLLSAAGFNATTAAALRVGAGTMAIVQPHLQSASHDGEHESDGQHVAMATLQASPVTNGGANQYTFNVAYSQSGSRRSMARNQSIVVAGPHGYRQSATLVSTTTPSAGQVTATYSIVPPGGTWNAADNGTYTVTRRSGGEEHRTRRSGGEEHRTRRQLGTFKVAINDGTPAPVNQAPSFTAGANQTAKQDAGLQTVANWATNVSAGDAGQTVSFATTTSNDALFATKPAVAANGTLTYTSAAGASGVATVTVQLKDSGGAANGGVDTSAAKTFTINVTPTPVPTPGNQAPSFTAGANQTAKQDAGLQTVANWATNVSAGPAGEASHTVSFLTSTSNDALFATKPAIAANGTLTYTPAAGASGVATVTVQLKDNGGVANGGVDTSAAKTFTITLTPTPVVVNAAPTFTAGPNQTGAQDAGAKTVANWATNISAGPITQPGQTLSFQATTSNDALFSVKPSIATNGTLTYTAAAGASGVATVTVLLKDSGGTANGGVDTSVAQTFTVTVTPAAPTIPSFVGSYTGRLVVPGVGHNFSATLSITSQTANGAFTGTLVSSSVSLNVTGTVAANGTYAMHLVTPPGTSHPGGNLDGTGSGTIAPAGTAMVIAVNFNGSFPGTLTVTKV